jgi:hypothetical protein
MPPVLQGRAARPADTQAWPAAAAARLIGTCFADQHGWESADLTFGHQEAFLGSSKKIRLAIYTALVGDKESLNDPLQLVGATASTDLKLDFFCFTDNEKLQSRVWQTRNFKRSLVPQEKASRLPKAKPHCFLPGYEYSLYIDNTVVFKRLPNSADLKGAAFKAFRHPMRTNPVDEADIVVKHGYDNPDIVGEQMRFYAGLRPLQEITTLTAGTVLLRKHNDKRVREFGEIWWEQILLFSKRDQLSLDLSAKEAGCPIAYFAGDKSNNDLFLWPVLPVATRVYASFDADLYAWNNRIDPTARVNPRAHFLEHGADAGQYGRNVALFRYACGKVGSSLGSSVAPRRCIAEPIQFMLDNADASVRSILIVGAKSAEIYSVEHEELLSARAAFKQYYRFGPEPTLFISHIPLAKILEQEPFINADQQNVFSHILVLGLSPQCHVNALAKFLPLLAADGQMLVQFGEGLTRDQLQQMHATIGHVGKINVFHGGHISSKTAIPSSVVLLDRRETQSMGNAVNS